MLFKFANLSRGGLSRAAISWCSASYFVYATLKFVAFVTISADTAFRFAAGAAATSSALRFLLTGGREGIGRSSSERSDALVGGEDANGDDLAGDVLLFLGTSRGTWRVSAGRLFTGWLGNGALAL